MRRLFALLTVLLCSASLTFARQAQAWDDHDDNGPIQAGYAVVTPVVVTAGATTGTTTTTGSSTSGTTVTTGSATGGTVTTGLVVFETFGLRNHDNDATQAGVLPPDLTTNALLFGDSDGRLGKNLGVAIVNPNSTNVNVNLTLRKKDGTTAATGTLNVPSHQQVAKMVTDLFATPSAVPVGFAGTLVITSAGTSSLPISVMGLRFRGANFSTIPVTNLAGDAGPLPNITEDAGGPGAVLLPQFAAGGGWATELVLVNSNTGPMTVRVDLFKQDGTALTTSLNGTKGSSFTGINIPAGGVVILAPRDRDGDDDF